MNKTLIAAAVALSAIASAQAAPTTIDFESVTAGITALVTVSAPTALARDLAEQSNLFLATLAGRGVAVFNP